jgi:hypothetical protein
LVLHDDGGCRVCVVRVVIFLGRGRCWVLRAVVMDIDEEVEFDMGGEMLKFLS